MDYMQLFKITISNVQAINLCRDEGFPSGCYNSDTQNAYDC
jgi:hypothetical protein